MTSRPLFFFTAWFAPAPAPSQRSDQSRQYLHSVRTCYCAVIISSTISLQKCCEKLRKDDHHIAFRGKSCLSGVRPSERPAGLDHLFPSTFSLLIGRCLGAKPKLFLWNSLIKPQRVWDIFKGMVTWDFSVFQKVKLGSVFSKVPHCWDL
jgi:hypothetical protein